MSHQSFNPSAKSFWSSQQGFTLLEAVLASAILALVTGGIVTLLNITLRAGASLETRIQAQYLLQEALEKARNSRDTTWIDGMVNSWDKDFTGQTIPKTVGDKTYKVETKFSDLSPDKKKVEVVIKQSDKEVIRGFTILTNWIKP